MRTSDFGSEPHWPDILTKKDLDGMHSEFFRELRLSISELRAEIHSLFRTQTIQLATIFGIINASMVAVLQFGR
jgi:hypothetical protein